jgi:nitrogen regulatory protein PII
MRMHRKKRIEIIIEAPLLRRVIARLEGRRVNGYSVLPVLSGLGQEGRWEASGLIGDAGRMVALICIVDPAECDGVMEDIYSVLTSQIGIVSVADVDVIRAEHF